MLWIKVMRGLTWGFEASRSLSSFFPLPLHSQTTELTSASSLGWKLLDNIVLSFILLKIILYSCAQVGWEVVWIITYSFGRFSEESGPHVRARGGEKVSQ